MTFSHYQLVDNVARILTRQYELKTILPINYRKHKLEMQIFVF